MAIHIVAHLYRSTPFSIWEPPCDQLRWHYPAWLFIKQATPRVLSGLPQLCKENFYVSLPFIYVIPRQLRIYEEYFFFVGFNPYNNGHNWNTQEERDWDGYDNNYQVEGFELSNVFPCLIDIEVRIVYRVVIDIWVSRVIEEEIDLSLDGLKVIQIFEWIVWIDLLSREFDLFEIFMISNITESFLHFVKRES